MVCSVRAPVVSRRNRSCPTVAVARRTVRCPTSMGALCPASWVEALGTAEPSAARANTSLLTTLPMRVWPPHRQGFHQAGSVLRSERVRPSSMRWSPMRLVRISRSAFQDGGMDSTKVRRFDRPQRTTPQAKTPGVKVLHRLFFLPRRVHAIVEITEILSDVSSRLAVVGAVLPGKLGGNSHNSAPFEEDSNDSNWPHDGTHASRVDTSRDKTVAASGRPRRCPQRIAAHRIIPVSARRSHKNMDKLQAPRGGNHAPDAPHRKV